MRIPLVCSFFAEQKELLFDTQVFNIFRAVRRVRIYIFSKTKQSNSWTHTGTVGTGRVARIYYWKHKCTRSHTQESRYIHGSTSKRTSPIKRCRDFIMDSNIKICSRYCKAQDVFDSLQFYTFCAFHVSTCHSSQCLRKKNVESLSRRYCWDLETMDTYRT